MPLICILIILGSTLALESTDLKNEPKIIGGVAVTNISQVAYQVSLLNKGRHMCGGSIINENFILTAAHCFNNVKNIRNIKIAYGILNLTENFALHDIKALFKHENYNINTMQNDIALLKLKFSIKFSETIQPIELQDFRSSNERGCMVSGWGVTDGGSSSNILMKTNVNTIPNDVCGIQLREGMICAGLIMGGRDACQGDSGGPLVCNKKLTGIVSWGIGCGAAFLPGVYTEVAYFHSWINETIVRSSSIQFKINTLTIAFIVNMYKILI